MSCPFFRYRNQKSILATDIMKDFELAELAGYCYEHPTNEDAWPTLQTMISTNKRAVVFVDRVVRPGDTDVAQSVGWFMAELGYVASNYWLNTVQGQWTCKQHQPYDANTGDILPRNLWLLNHLMYNNVSATVQIPARNKANVTNQIVSLQDHANQCLTTYARPQVNFISVDFYEVVDYAVLRIVDALNRVQRSSYGTGPVTTMTHSRTTKTSLATTTTVEATQTAQGSGMTRNPPSGAGKIAANIGVTLIGGFVVALL